MTMHVALSTPAAGMPVGMLAPLSRPCGEVMRTAAAIAAAQAAEAMLNSLHLAYPPAWLEGVFTEEECLTKASGTVEDLLDYAALAGVDAVHILRAAAASVEWREEPLTAGEHLIYAARLLRRMS